MILETLPEINVTVPFVTPLYAGFLGVLNFFLVLHVIGYRHKARVSLGTNNDPELERRVRIHGNFIEFVPICLILMLLVELSAIGVLWVHFLGLTLLCGRILHVLGIYRLESPWQARVGGMLLTFICLLTGSGLVIYQYLRVVLG